MSADADEDMARRIADCLEDHLGSYGFSPYRYPSGENKSVTLSPPESIALFDDAGNSWRVEVRRA